MRHRVVFDEIAEKRVAFLPDRRFERDRMPGDIQHLAYLLIRDIHGAGDFVLGWLSLENLLQTMPGFLHPVDRLADVDRQPDRAALIGDRAGDRLANPPGRVGGEFEAALVVELVGRLHQADVAFLDEIEEGKTAADVLLGNRDDESEIGADQMSAGELAVELVGVEDRSLLGSQIRVQQELFGDLAALHALGRARLPLAS